MRAELRTAHLHYGNGVQLHTAASGNVASLHALYLLLHDENLDAIAEVRINIPYLNGYGPQAVIDDALATLAKANWAQGAGALLAELDEWAAGCTLPVRNLIDVALHDWLAKRAGVALAVYLGAQPAPNAAWGTNQTLFWSPFDTFIQQARAYVARGYRELKVRVAVADFAEDLRRIKALRDEFGDEVKISADANGQWSYAGAQHHLDLLAGYGLAYLEQPIAAGDWDALGRLAETSPLPLMVDESLASPEDVARLCELRGRIWAHLKLVKLGGIGPSIAAAHSLQRAGVPFMIGQMNEGAAATAAALHVACATGPAFAELYGADGLVDDAAAGIRYAAGRVQAAAQPGLGVTFDATKTQLIRSFQ
ncbi:mandelate racemase/muconate lactonizing enzyme family protein [Pseudomonas typographi]|uniref:Mandelate racemase/muconate lactonizing enzyme family protein n=1 Tax=Pseudomonas typographi TaxID=2715964 RepID=A0ABR7Z471_9PSED|nr:mandelate racemase/muconate lactonizing enzyme family protein [Pseudomonas typographi]MBD1552943.1 mandelate racemase/muconate lactonizing enzyme family protein [Pseudomonas typographi]MBD1588318.1 mandelate racemase/muconate lactonizing enzyme family protein [Pseudomonas typographi]MBD1600289.1 mandelate racemase/muconate lactonizing enzyme family protein [Pseudomonas typographi]